MSSDDGDDELPDLLIDFKYQFTTIRLSDQFVPSTITIKAELLSINDDGMDDFDLAITKVRFWLDTIVSRAVIFTRGNTVALDMLLNEEGRNRSNNVLMLTPSTPTDDHLAVLLQAKLSALAGPNLSFGSVEISSNNAEGMTFTFVGSHETVLPSMEEWIGVHSYFDKPWWNRNDASTIDVIPGVDADLSIKPVWAYSLDFLDNAVRGHSNDSITPTSSTPLPATIPTTGGDNIINLDFSPPPVPPPDKDKK